VVIFSGKLSAIRYDDIDRNDVDAMVCLVHVSLIGLRETTTRRTYAYQPGAQKADQRRTRWY
jgi:hypothetical protein